MPTPVRSRRFFGPILVAASPQLLYTVPAGRTAVLKTLSLSAPAVAVPNYSLRVNGVAGANQLYGGAVAAGLSVLLFDLVVLNPGDTLHVVTASLNLLVIAGFGSLLDGSPS